MLMKSQTEQLGRQLLTNALKGESHGNVPGGLEARLAKSDKVVMSISFESSDTSFGRPYDATRKNQTLLLPLRKPGWPRITSMGSIEPARFIPDATTLPAQAHNRARSAPLVLL
jgi:hypothetical protein